MKTNYAFSSLKHAVTSIMCMILLSSCVATEAFAYSQTPKTAPSATQIHADVSGVYDTDYGELTISQQGQQIRGSYPDGEIKGVVTGYTVEGTWKQTYSQGRITFQFRTNLSGFSGVWGTGEDPPTSPWNGTRKAGTLKQAPIAPSVVETALDISGLYDSSYGELSFSQMGNRIEGSYPTGTIEAVMHGRIVTGSWIQSGSRGLIRFEFSPDGRSFIGYWGYNQDEPTYSWEGTRIGRSTTVTQGPATVPVRVDIHGTYQSTFGDIQYTQIGTNVSGVYPTGVIEGTLNGTVLDGMWIESHSQGKIRFTFTSDFSQFHGLYGRDAEQPHAIWDGAKY